MAKNEGLSRLVGSLGLDVVIGDILVAFVVGDELDLDVLRESRKKWGQTRFLFDMT